MPKSEENKNVNKAKGGQVRLSRTLTPCVKMEAQQALVSVCIFQFPCAF